jgi:hypothetical protein
MRFAEGGQSYETKKHGARELIIRADELAQMMDALGDEVRLCHKVLLDNNLISELKKARQATGLKDWYFHFSPVEYFDTHERRQHERIDNAMSKESRFAYQRETRFLWAGLGRAATGFIDLDLGPLTDIATYTEYP